MEVTLNLEDMGTSGCAFKGSFEGYESRIVALSSRDCPINANSMLQISFCIDVICPNHVIFDAHSNGTGIAHVNDQNVPNVQFDSITAENFHSNALNKPFTRSGQTYELTDEFDLKLKIYYDDVCTHIC